MPPQRTPLQELFGEHNKNHEFSPYQRGMLAAARAMGHRTTWISKQLHTPESSIRTTLSRAPLRNEGRSQLRSGRPKVLSDQDQRHILRIVRNNPKFTYQEVREATGVTCCARTLSRFLDTYNIKKWRAAGRPELREEHVAIRLAWALEHVDWTEAQWAKVIWSDECSAERGKGEGREWVFRTPCQKWDPGMIQPYKKGKDISIMVWAGFSGKRGRSPLHVMIRDPLSKRGGYSADSYLEVLEENIPKVWRRGMLFMQDNAPIHTAIKVRDWFTQKRVNMIDWPPYSPDLNPIEHLWFHLKAMVLRLYPELSELRGNIDYIREKLGQALQEAWKALPQSLFDNVLGSMKRRCEAVIQAEGWHTKY